MIKRLKKSAVQFISDESGQSTTEYILILALVVMIAMKVKTKLGSTLEGAVGTLDEKIQSGLGDIN